MLEVYVLFLYDIPSLILSFFTYLLCLELGRLAATTAAVAYLFI